MPNGPKGQGGPRQANTPIKSGQAILDEAMVRWTRAVALFTFLLVVASAISDYFIWKELSDSEAEHALTREQLRASMAFTGVQSIPGIAADSGKINIGFTSNFRNIGGTRTSRTRGWASVHFFLEKVPNNFDVTKPYDEVKWNVDSVVAANGQFPIPVGLPIDDFRNAVEGKGIILLWGRVEYATIYEPDRTIPVAFCLIVTPLRPKSSATSVPTPLPVPSSQPTPQTGIATINPIDVNSDIFEGAIGATFAPYKADCNYSQ